jgi:hypothetical protein
LALPPAKWNRFLCINKVKWVMKSGALVVEKFGRPTGRARNDKSWVGEALNRSCSERRRICFSRKSASSMLIAAFDDGRGAVFGVRNAFTSNGSRTRITCSVRQFRSIKSSTPRATRLRTEPRVAFIESCTPRASHAIENRNFSFASSRLCQKRCE